MEILDKALLVTFNIFFLLDILHPIFSLLDIHMEVIHSLALQHPHMARLMDKPGQTDTPNISFEAFMEGLRGSDSDKKCLWNKDYPPDPNRPIVEHPADSTFESLSFTVHL